MVWLGGCQSPDELLPPVSRKGINSITAKFYDGTGEFIGLTDSIKNEIVIPIPYFYPEESDDQVTSQMLEKMRVVANLDNNVTVEPSLLFLNLNPENSYTITVTDVRKGKQQYTIRGEIRKSSKCAIESFKIDELNLDGVINETAKTISIVTMDNLPPAKASVTISTHATISPDPRTTEIDYNTEPKFTVTAHDGTTAVYTVIKNTPAKLPAGIRPGSAKLMFAKKVIADLGGAANNNGGMAATKDYILISSRSNASILVDAKSGALISTVDVSVTGGGLNNFYNTADNAGHVLISNLAQNAGTFKIWKLNLPSGTPELYINWSSNTTDAVGRKFSVKGDITGDAIITAPLLTATDNRFARWRVVGGALQSQTPEIVTVNGIHWTTNVDVVCTSATDVTADYFIARYGSDMKPNPIAGQSNIYSLLNWIKGADMSLYAELVDVNGNFVANAVDYTYFNNIPYALVNYVNSFTWGQADRVYLVNASSKDNFTGIINPYGGPGDVGGAIEWISDLHIYGAMIGSGTANGNATGDCAFVQSPDGFFLYVYFMFTNGYLVGVQFDCIDL